MFQPSARSVTVPRRLLPLAALVVLLLAPATLFWIPPESAAALWPRWAALLALGWWLPGVLLVARWRLPGLDVVEQTLFGLGLGLCWLVLGVLVVHWLPGELALWPLVAWYSAGILALLAPAPGAQDFPAQVTLRVPSTGTWLWLGALLLLAVTLRLPGLGYHEFHYDEVLVLSRAREAVRGADDAFARHTKGPGELAVATALFRSMDTADEATARAPFGVASVGAVLALALLARRLLESAAAGFWSGVLLAFNGFALGLSRIVQYQAAVLLLMTLAVWAGWEFARSGRSRWLGLAATLSAFGMVFHYEFGLLAPLLLWLAWQGRQRSHHPRTVDATILGAGAAGAILLLAAYLPSYLHPYFANTQSYLGTRLGALGRTFNLAFFAEMGLFYNSVYYAVGLLLLAGAGLWLAWRRRRQVAWLVLLWFTPFLLLYLFIVEFPGTHFYLLMPSWSLAAGLALAHWSTPPAPRALRHTVIGAAVLWLAVSGVYLYLMFFRQAPEYLINYQEERISFFWAPYGDTAPAKPRFGFPIQEGWATLGVLSEWKFLNGTYAANEYSRHLRWYLGDFERIAPEEEPDFLFVASHLQEPDPAFPAEIPPAYQHVGMIRVRGEPRIQIWAREPLPVAFVTYDAEQFRPIFPGVAPALREWPDPVNGPAAVAMGNGVTLAASGFEPTNVRPGEWRLRSNQSGETVHVYLRWQVDTPPWVDAKLFVHVAGADGRPVVQWDGLPGLNTMQTSRWEAGRIGHDHVLLDIPPTTPPDDYTLLAGLYDPATGDRLGEPVRLGTLRVR